MERLNDVRKLAFDPEQVRLDLLGLERLTRAVNTGAHLVGLIQTLLQDLQEMLRHIAFEPLIEGLLLDHSAVSFNFACNASRCALMRAVMALNSSIWIVWPVCLSFSPSSSILNSISSILANVRRVLFSLRTRDSKVRRCSSAAWISNSGLGGGGIVGLPCLSRG